MTEFFYQVTDPMGIHARPASCLYMEAVRFQCNIEAEYRGTIADVKNIIDIMGLGAGCGSQIKFRLDGIDEAEASAAIQSILHQL